MKKRGAVVRSLALVAALATASSIVDTTPAQAAAGDCSQPLSSGSAPTASDCLFILRVAVGSDVCDPECMCAPKGTMPATTTDALLCLNKAVGRTVTLACDCTPATRITVLNLDGANEGFNSEAPASPVGGNSGTTLGAQRLIAFQYAADRWAELVSSPVEIFVDATFDSLPCNSFGAVLGAAGPLSAFADFPAAPRASTWYPAALANKLAGADLDPGASDIVAFFNSAVGTTCDFPLKWYYGLDGNAPSNRIDFVSVVLHELGHGLGFLTFVDLSNGQGMSGLDDHYMVHLENHDTGRMFPEITPSNRLIVMQSGSKLHWVAPNVASGATSLSTGVTASGHVQMYAPSPVEPGSSVSHFNTALAPDELMEPFYTGPQHDVGLALQLMLDIGWDGR